jgi:16S rRNA (adenine1518-N6/adenine1519-N6)-dimethyltransferase
VPIRKRFGQHFLTDRRALERIVQALAPDRDETIVEIGAGRGALTDLLIGRASRVVAIEIDGDLVRQLQVRYAGRPGIEIVEGDVLRQSLSALAAGPFSVVGNVPYYITTPILFHALQHPRPRRMVFLVQREVAERVCSAPGTRDYGALTVNLAALAIPAIAGNVPARAFQPPPTVDSSILTLAPRAVPLCEPAEEGVLRELVVGLFGQRRRQLVRGIRTVAGLGADDAKRVLEAAGVDPMARPETLGPEAFVRLLRALARREAPNAAGSRARS